MQQKNPLGYTNFKEISKICTRPHFNGRQHGNEAETKTGLKHVRQLFKNKHRFVNVTIRPGFARSVQIIVFPKVEIRKDIMF